MLKKRVINKLRKRRIKTTGTDRSLGQSMVEMALTFTMLMMILAATVDIGRAFYAYIAIRDAAQEGAAYGSLNPGDVTGIVNHVRESSTDPFDLTDVSTVAVSVTWPDGSLCAGNGIHIQVTYDLQMMMPLITMFLPDGELLLTANMIDTILRPPC